MKLPNLSSPVQRNDKGKSKSKGINPSCGLACQACKAAGLPSFICNNL